MADAVGEADEEIGGAVLSSSYEQPHISISESPKVTAGKVINDLHYNGKMVNERSAVEGLFDQFKAAVQTRDAMRIVALLEQVAITKLWATRLAKMILEGPSQASIQFSLNDPRNAGVIRRNYLQDWRDREQSIGRFLGVDKEWLDYRLSHANVHCQRVDAELRAAEEERLRQFHDEASSSRVH